MRNIQTVNKLIARELNYNEDLVEKVNSFFWKEVRRSLSSMESANVYIKHIGTITTSRRKINQFISTTIAKIRSITKSKRFKESTKALLLETNYDRLRKALKQRNILANQYYVSSTKRIHKADSNDLGQQGEDSGGHSQSSEE